MAGGGIKRKIGDSGEVSAVSFLERKGFAILERNYRFNHGEIDVVAREGEELVFVEVKTRTTTKFGFPEESVTPEKQQLIRRTAEGYVREKKLENVLCRFDVIAIKVEQGRETLMHFRNAF